MLPYEKEIERIKSKIKCKFNPQDIFLFGSCAKGAVTANSDIDICVIINTNNKRQTVQEILLEVTGDIDVDVVVYTPEEWEKYKDDRATFAHVIYSKGVSIIG